MPHTRSSLWIATEREEVFVREAKQAVHKVLATELKDKWKRILLDALLWQITVAHGKYTTRFRSVGVVEDGVILKDLRHDHVFTRRWLLEKLLAPSITAGLVDQILDKAVACTVTKDEHNKKLAGMKEASGWERYECAGILVYDCAVKSIRSFDWLKNEFPPL